MCREHMDTAKDLGGKITYSPPKKYWPKHSQFLYLYNTQNTFGVEIKR